MEFGACYYIIIIMKNKGFTLVELLVVIAIIGILSSVVIASMNSARIRARDARRVSDIKQIQLALEMYYNVNSYYPIAANATNLDMYLSTIPTDPLGTAYSYAGLGSGATCSNFHLGATFENSSDSSLAGDKDAAAVAGTQTCSGATDFAGTDPVYDVKGF